jgi:amino acid adenylation domain-containing protein
LNQHLSDDRLTEGQIRDYWSKLLAGWQADQVMMPDTKPGLGQQSSRINRWISASSQIDRYCKNREDLKAVFLLTALSETFSALSAGAADLVISMPAIPRSNDYELQRMHDKLSQWLPIRFRNEPPPATFREALHKALELVKQCYNHSRNEELYQEISAQFSAELSRIRFVYEPLHGKASNYGEDVDLIAVASLEQDDRQRNSGQRLRLELVGAPYYSSTLLASLADMYVRILTEALGSELQAPLKQIDLLTDSQKACLAAWNETSYPFDAKLTITEAIGHIVLEQPDRPAVVDGREQWSYRELYINAMNVAIRLRNAEFKQGDRIAVMMERSANWVAAFLGILHAGCVYVPIDPAYPAERIEAMLQDSEAAAIIGDRGSPAYFAATYYHIHELTTSTTSSVLSYNSYSSGALPHALAYLLFTSGSTGRPKGVMVEHRGIINLTNLFKHTMGIRPEDRIIQFASASFDASIWEMAMALLTGASLIIARPDSIADSRAFEQLLRDQRVTAATLPPAYAAQLTPERLPELRTLITAGSEAHPELPARWSSKVRYYNAYGPTETTICATVWESPHQHVDSFEQHRSIVPIGRPLPNMTVTIVNSRLQRLPTGMAGELCVGGIGLARGYWNRPDMTEERFVLLPEDGTRVYRTGDLARWTETGDIEFLGRMDHQVKIRGFRIETEEIALAIRGLKGVETAVVVAKPDERGENVLLAYYTGENAPLSKELADSLAAKLPRHMLPELWVRLPAIPLTMNGKPDRRALPGVAEAAAMMEREAFEAPRGAIENELAQLWAKVLSVSSIGRHERFFEIGGHSLRAAKLGSLLYEQFSVDIPLEQLVEHSSLAEMAELIDWAQQKAHIQPIARAPQALAYRASPAQRRVYAVEKSRQAGLLYVLPFALWVEGELAQADRFEAALCKLIERHEPLRTSFGWHNGDLVQIIAEHAPFHLNRMSLPIEQLSEIADNLSHTFIVEQAPLLRADWIDWSDGRTMLYIQLHHLIADGMSLGLLVRDLNALLMDDPLEPLRLQYKDYSEWLLTGSAEQGGQAAQAEAHWLRRFEGFSSRSDLPIDYTRPAMRQFAGDTIAIQWNQDLVADMQSLAIKCDATVHLTLLAAYYVLLAQTTGENDWTVGSLHSGRSHPDAAEMVGMFVHTLAHRQIVPQDMPFNKFVGQVKRNVMDDYTFSDYPFETLVRKLGIRDTSRNPLFDTMFVLQNLEIPLLTSGELALTPFRLEERLTRFDLVLQAWDNNDGMLLWITYATALFHRDTVERLASDYRLLLEQLAEDPSARIGDLRLTNLSARAQPTNTSGSALDFEF